RPVGLGPDHTAPFRPGAARHPGRRRGGRRRPADLPARRDWAKRPDPDRAGRPRQHLPRGRGSMNPADRRTTRANTVVVGAGVAGLAVTRMLRRRGIPVVAFDEHLEIGHTWRNRYDNLRLNSVRWLSQMPDQALPKRYGR